MKRIHLIGKIGKGKYAIIDDNFYEKLVNYKWYLATTGYAVRYKGRKMFFMHREIMQAQGRLNYVDHKNSKRLDNRVANLRICTPQESARHIGLKCKSASGFKGVTWYKPYLKWRTRIMVDGKDFYLGYFVKKVEAAKAYNRKALELFGEFAFLNKV